MSAISTSVRLLGGLGVSALLAVSAAGCGGTPPHGALRSAADQTVSQSCEASAYRQATSDPALAGVAKGSPLFNQEVSASYTQCAIWVGTLYEHMAV